MTICFVVHFSVSIFSVCFFFFNDTATTEIYTLSLHDALPISARKWRRAPRRKSMAILWLLLGAALRSEEHTSELQSLTNLVCRLLLEKKKKDVKFTPFIHRAFRPPYELPIGRR